jgi:hypothetical protein
MLLPSAIATVYGCEYLLTWNCRHIANAELHQAIRRVVEQYGCQGQLANIVLADSIAFC